MFNNLWLMFHFITCSMWRFKRILIERCHIYREFISYSRTDKSNGIVPSHFFYLEVMTTSCSAIIVIKFISTIGLLQFKLNLVSMERCECVSFCLFSVIIQRDFSVAGFSLPSDGWLVSSHHHLYGIFGLFLMWFQLSLV